MGTVYEFICESCGYQARVCGGRDRGFYAIVETMICHDCCELVDVPVGDTRSPAVKLLKGEIEIEEFRKLMPEYEAKNKERFGHCPQCKGMNVSRWEDSQLCPKCGGHMIRGKFLAYWD